MTPNRAEDVIPDDIREAAEAAGLTTPLWYVGRRKGHEDPSEGLGAAVARGRAAAGLGPAKLVRQVQADPNSSKDLE